MANEEEPGSTPENASPAEAPAQPPPTLEEQLQKLEQDKRELHDRLLRTAAEFDNYKKRAKKEMDDSATRGREQLLKELLPALDNLERALKHAPENDPLAVGVKQTEKQLLQALEKFGVVRFTSQGQPFDPALHDAIQQVETDAMPPGTVATEFASGYKINGRLLRPAMVAVAKALALPPAESGNGEAPSEGDGHAAPGEAPDERG